jgi:hypothetical protein
MRCYNRASDALLDGSFACQREIIQYYGLSECALVKTA